MSKKKSIPLDTPEDSFEQAILDHESTVAPTPTTASVLESPAPIAPLDAFFLAISNPLSDERNLAVLAAKNPDWAAHVDAKGFNALTLALLSKKLILSAELIALGSDPNAASLAMGWNPLVLAAGNVPGDDALAYALLDRGANPSSKLRDGLYALTAACTYGNLALAERLLGAGAHPAPADAGWLPIIAASGSGHMKLIELLMERGADPNASLSPSNGYRSVHQAVKAGHLHIVKALLAKGVEINSMAHDGSTPLHIAAECGNTEMGKLLLKAGANANLENVAGKIAAETSRDPALATLLTPQHGPRVKHPLSVKTKKRKPSAALPSAPDSEPDKTPKKASVKTKASVKAKTPVKTTKKTAMKSLAETAVKKIAAKTAAKNTARTKTISVNKKQAPVKKKPKP